MNKEEEKKHSKGLFIANIIYNPQLFDESKMKVKSAFIKDKEYLFVQQKNKEDEIFAKNFFKYVKQKAINEALDKYLKPIPNNNNLLDQVNQLKKIKSYEPVKNETDYSTKRTHRGTRRNADINYIIEKDHSYNFDDFKNKSDEYVQKTYKKVFNEVRMNNAKKLIDNIIEDFELWMIKGRTKKSAGAYSLSYNIFSNYNNLIQYDNIMPKEERIKIIKNKLPPNIPNHITKYLLDVEQPFYKDNINKSGSEEIFNELYEILS